MNNIMDHYVTAWFDFHLKGVNREEYLSSVPANYEERLSLEHLTIGQ